MFFYNRAGKLISNEEYFQLFCDNSYCILQKTFFENFEISTIWAGVRIRLETEPKIFETMIFNSINEESETYIRASQEEEAFQNHKKAIGRVFKKVIANAANPTEQVKKYLTHEDPIIRELAKRSLE